MHLRYLQMRRRLWIGAASALLAVLAATRSGSAAASDNGKSVTTYSVRGVFKESRADGRVAVIAHERIPGYMEAMTMPFNVKKPAELKGLNPGQPITFRLSVADDDDWIDDIRKVKGPPVKASAPEPAAAVPQVEAGAPVPECLLTNQAGRAIRLADFKGQALAFTFFFTRCPLPTFCPRMNNNFAAVQDTLKSDAARTNWQLLSISFDPGFDTPDLLREFAKLHQSDASHWSFATSSREEIRKFGAAFGLQFWHENGSVSHNLRTVIVDVSGRVTKVFSGNEWRPADVAAELRRAMGVP